MFFHIANEILQRAKQQNRIKTKPIMQITAFPQWRPLVQNKYQRKNVVL